MSRIEHAIGSAPYSRLTVVGTGIQIARDLTPEARNSIRAADKVFYLASDLVAARIIQDLNPRAESLHTLYGVGKPRMQTYEEMVERIIGEVRAGSNVCVAVYGHPGFFAYPTHRAIAELRREGYSAVMVPAVSSIDCLFADLGIDPGASGLQIYDASDFLLKMRRFDPQIALILLQLNVILEPRYEPEPHRAGLLVLVERLSQHYGVEHDAVVYSAAEYLWGEPEIQRVTMGTLRTARIEASSTLYVPPKGIVSIDKEMQRRLDERVNT